MSAPLHEASAQAFAALRARGEHVSFAESLTGGMIAAALVENPGASDVLNESYVTYASSSKVRILGVRQQTVDAEGVVSARCAAEMAEGVRRISGADWGVSATGLAGPDGGTPETPVGTVFIGISSPAGTQAYEFHFTGPRKEIRKKAACAAFEELRRQLS